MYVAIVGHIAMRDEESLRIVQETVKNGICKLRTGGRVCPWYFCSKNVERKLI